MRRWLATMGFVGLVACGEAGSPPAALGPVDGAGLAANELGRVKVGDAVPDFTLEDIDGRRVTLSGLRGSLVLLVFYRGHW